MCASAEDSATCSSPQDGSATSAAYGRVFTIDLDGDDSVVVFAPLDRPELERQELLDEAARIAEQARSAEASAPTLLPGLPSVLPSSATFVAAATTVVALAPCFVRI